MRIYLFRMDKNEAQKGKEALVQTLQHSAIPIATRRTFAGNKTQPMSPVYAHIEGDLLRVKWAEEQEMVKPNPQGSALDRKPVQKRAVLIADFAAGTAELRLNPPENVHSYADGAGRPTAPTYYNAYLQKALDVLGCKAHALRNYWVSLLSKWGNGSPMGSSR